MGKSRSVWGIDVGQCALKALKLADTDDGPKALAFDYIEHAKILSQADADPPQLIRQALDTFLSRNEVKGDLIAMSVPGQSAIARFIKLPPVEVKKIPDIVRYEARQQIPFDLEDVVWTYQMMGDGTVEEGFALEAEFGLFAIKREFVQDYLSIFLASGMDVSIVQVAPISVFNYFVYDREVKPEDGAVVLMNMGADTTDLVITDGRRLWQRNIPLGGNSFTRSLTRDFKLTFAKAEHLKRNATKSKDARRVLQAMRPVFNDVVGEVQRSVGFYTSANRDVKVTKLIGMGNGFKLPGLQRFIAQHLKSQNMECDVVHLDTFHRLGDSPVLDAPIFKENILTFPVAYGLALQGLGLGRLSTNLILPEMARRHTWRHRAMTYCGARAAAWASRWPVSVVARWLSRGSRHGPG